MEKYGKNFFEKSCNKIFLHTFLQILVMGTKSNCFLQILCIKIAIFGQFEELGLLKPQIWVTGISPCGTIDFSTWKQCLSQHAYMWNHPSSFALLCSGLSIEEFHRS